LTPLQSFWERFGTTIITVVNLTIFATLWQTVQGGDTPLIDTRWIPAPLDILSSGIRLITTGTLWPHFIFSGANYLIGFGLTIVFGIPVGVLLGLNPTIRNVAQTFTWVGYSMPTIALLPIGYAAEKPVPQSRRPLSELVHAEGWRCPMGRTAWPELMRTASPS